MGRVSMPQGKGSQLHNRREYEKIGKPIPDNIDVSKSSENITLVDKDIKQAYQEIFGEALEKYNAKQKRADRKMRTTATTSRSRRTAKSCSMRMWCSGAVKRTSEARDEERAKKPLCSM